MIDRPEQLSLLPPRLHAAEWIAADTEADSLHAYPEKLCLIQISIPEDNLLIDPLAKLDLTPVLEALRGRELILHGADYDLRLLFRTFQFVPKAVFDTMIAARLLGCAKFGLTDLVSEFVGVKLEKGPQKMNWARRPLTDRMAAYAVNDTRYLQPLADILASRLRELGRLSWHAETCSELVRDCVRPRREEPDTAWRIKGSDRLPPAALGVLREVWGWREREAIAADKPPYFVLSHESLIDLARAASSDQPFDGFLPRSMGAQRQERLISAIERGLKLAPAELPAIRRSQGVRLTKGEQIRFEEMRRLRDERAAKLSIDPTLIANRADLIDIAKDPSCMDATLMRWQREVLNGG